MRSHLKQAILIVATMSASSVAGCSDDETNQRCYPLDPMLEYTPPFIPLCEWPAGELPEPPPEYEYTNRVTAVFEPTDDQPCDPCDLELFDALLKKEIQKDCDQPYANFQRACYSPPDGTGMGSGRWCSVYGTYASDCVPSGQ